MEGRTQDKLRREGGVSARATSKAHDDTSNSNQDVIKSMNVSKRKRCDTKAICEARSEDRLEDRHCREGWDIAHNETGGHALD
jgi:hypothetical protein